MEEGVFEVPAHGLWNPRWLSGAEKETIAGFGPSFHKFEGYRCRGCKRMLVSY
jgi:hypothetical protein